MKRMSIAVALAFAAGGAAFAADLPPPAPPPPPPRAPAIYVPVAAPVFSWSGFYFGINGGYSFGTSTFAALPPFTGSSFSTSGFLGGGTLGGNYQIGAFVIGLEGDLDWADFSGSAACKTGGGPNTCATKSDFLGTGRARAGFAWDRVLFYGTGGAAFGNIKSGIASSGGFNNADKIGWTAGAGIEAAFAPNWTARVEYLYVSLEDLSCTTACFGAGTPINISLKENVVRAGIDYKFGW